MSAPDGSAANGNPGILNGHGVAIAMIAIFAGMGLVVAFAASDGAIFGINSSLGPNNNGPVVDNDTGGADVISRDAFDEETDEESAPSTPSSPSVSSSPPPPTSPPSPRPDAESNVASVPRERGPTLSEDQRQLLAMSNFSWDSIAMKHISASQDIMNMFDQQNFTRQRPVEPGAEPFFLSDRVSGDVERNRVVVSEITDIETSIDTTAVDADEEEQEEEEDNSDSGPDNDEDQPEESDEGEEEDEGEDSGSNNSTDTNTTRDEALQIVLEATRED
jgi:hypothetical protein